MRARGRLAELDNEVQNDMIDTKDLQRFETNDGIKFDGRKLNGQVDPLIYIELRSNTLNDLIQTFINIDLDKGSTARMSYDPKEITYSDILYNTFTAFGIAADPIYKDSLIWFDFSKFDRVNKVTKNNAGIITSIDPDFTKSLMIKIIAYKSNLQSIVTKFYNSGNVLTADLKNAKAKMHLVYLDGQDFIDPTIGCIRGTKQLNYFKYFNQLTITDVFNTKSTIENELKDWNNQFGLLP